MKNYPDAYIDFLIEFHASRDYFECHEILEDYWKDEDRSPHWPALIQLAVAVYHERQQNYRGSLRLYRKVLNHLQTMHEAIEALAIDVESLRAIVKNRINNILNEKAYTPLNLPLTDDELISQCEILSKDRGLQWKFIEDLSDDQLIYRHKLRDRSN